MKKQACLFAFLVLFLSFAINAYAGNKNDLAYLGYNELNSVTSLTSSDELVIFESSVPKKGATITDLLSYYGTTGFTIYDGVTDSPALVLKDATAETASFVKTDGSNLTMTIAADDALQVTTGNLRVGNGSNDIAQNGEDAYVEGTFEVDGAVRFDGAVILGDAVTDINTITGKISGATPLTFDGATANTVYTIFAMDDPTSSSKTITFPAVTGTVNLSSAAVVLTAGSAVSATVAKGKTLYTLTPNDNEDTTITFSGTGSAGDEATFIFTSSGTGDEVITFHTTLANVAGTLTLGTTAAHSMAMRFVSDGSIWHEVSRTADLV